MISFASCVCALLFARLALSAPAPAASSSAPTVSTVSSVIAPISPTAESSVAASSASNKPRPTSTATATEPTATVPFIDLDPNEPLWNEDTPGIHQPIHGSLGAKLLGPTNNAIVKQNPDLLAPPTTDHGSVPNAKWPFSLSHNRLQTGGWAREENIAVMPVAQAMASVNMRLEAGAVRELHWHKTAEWAYVLKGSTQVTAVDADGRNFVSTVGPGDLWYFPPGIPHSLQATNDDPDGSEFVLVFDSGSFSEDSTFLLTDWLDHVPAEVLAKNFQVNISAFAHIPAEELYIFPAALPEPDSAAPKSPQGTVPDPFSFSMSKVKPTQLTGGTVKVVDSTTFKISKTIAAAEVTVEPGAIRELHWHPTQDEWSFFIEGEGRMTIFASQSNARTFNYQAGDIGYVPATMGHYLENTGNTTLRFLEIFKSEKFQDISLAQWLALTPPKLVKEHLGFSDDVIARLSKTKLTVVGPK
ncbi:Oxalate decarboxylase OxdC [Hypsizygus marmoreus]|uniref:Oxalate decarboxylase OxdC n=1 Tax=Hypsizygus marmoreus TaxID=39966 RepID=A0A369K4T3_HYPMA|nr:Oxalate decarboxylase OxdC [Hypsizygus marmoreus]